MIHLHVIPVDLSLTVEEAWKELCVFGYRVTDTGAECWAQVRCDGEECRLIPGVEESDHRAERHVEYVRRVSRSGLN